MSHKQLQRRSFLKNDDLIIFIEFDDLTPLIKSEVPIRLQSFHERHRRAVDYAGYVQEPQRPLLDFCDPGYCLNGGVCVMTKGKASCRCGSTQTHLYFGEHCEQVQIHGSLFGVVTGATAGVIVLAIAIISMISKTHNS
ncbi:meprin A subunit alpha-like [Rhincodon typus]|uniref:meprin A subunit alpha-like n=1 Tax=Rhincodon typus TaxID=259920 RepID=UPI00202E7F32|nr:meprin A subunit alpha-like [Rhincodon typus]